MDNISIIIPVVREEKAFALFESLRTTAPNAEVVWAVDREHIGCPAMVNKLVRQAKNNVIVFLGDDTIPQPGWLEAAYDKLSELDGPGVVGLNTRPGNDHAHWMAHRAFLEHMPDGQFFNEAYRHCYCDDELKDIAVELGRWAFAEDATIEHDHPVNGATLDEHYLRAYSDETKEHDRRTYYRRKRERYGRRIAVGFPLVDPTVPIQFFTSFVSMEKPDSYRIYVPRLPHGPFNPGIAEARCSIVEQALMDGCSHLYMMDTDQVYPTDTMTKLMAHGVDICGVSVPRRWPPFRPILYRGQIGDYKYISDDEMYSGDLIEIDATGTGCLLINMSVFDDIPRPFFATTQTDKGEPVGEDIYFCHKVREAGRRIFADTSVEVGHMTSFLITKDFAQFHDAFVKSKGAKGE